VKRRDRPRLRVVDHPLARHTLSQLRDPDVGTEPFRRALERLSLLLMAEASRDLPLVHARLETPHGAADVDRIESASMACLAILRSGLGMLAGLQSLLPGTAVGHVGLRRDPETKQAREYFLELPPDPGGPWFVLDPMIATGGSAVRALDRLVDHEVAPQRIRFVAVVVAPEGVDHVAARHPDVRVFAAALDSHLNADKEIVPGIGDVGDRLFGTVAAGPVGS
jgi:uracil phosphoribosyltransferase